MIGIVMWMWAGWSPVRNLEGEEILHSSKMSRLALGSTQPPSQRVLALFPWGLKRTVHEADCLPASSVEVKNERSYTSPSWLCLHTMYWDNCTFFTELRFPVILVSSQLYTSYCNIYSYTVLLSSIVISISYAERCAC